MKVVNILMSTHISEKQLGQHFDFVFKSNSD